MESGQEEVPQREASNEALAEQLAFLIAQDKENRIHTPVIRLGFERDKNEQTRLHEGYVVTASTDNKKHLFLLDTPRGKRVIVISPRHDDGVEAPGVEDPEEFAEYLKQLHYDPSPKRQHYTRPYEYSLAYTTKGGITTSLPGHFLREEMLLADSSTHTARSVRQAMKDAISFGRSTLAEHKVAMPQGPPAPSKEMK